VDKVLREHLWNAKNEDTVNAIMHLLQHSDWPEFASAIDRKDWALEWGLMPENIFHRNYNIISLHNPIQYTYYRDVLSCITKKLGKECVENQELAKLILKKALATAKEKDKEITELIRVRNPQFVGSDRNQEILKRAKKRLYYTKKKAAEKNQTYYLEEQAGIYAGIIEEYELFTVLQIIP
jgi:hypothetical protein